MTELVVKLPDEWAQRKGTGSGLAFCYRKKQDLSAPGDRQSEKGGRP